jgi:hypothetical protein
MKHQDFSKVKLQRVNCVYLKVKIHLAYER